MHQLFDMGKFQGSCLLPVNVTWSLLLVNAREGANGDPHDSIHTYSVQYIHIFLTWQTMGNQRFEYTPSSSNNVTSKHARGIMPYY